MGLKRFKVVLRGLKESNAFKEVHKSFKGFKGF